MKLKGLLAIAVGSWSGVAEIDNGSSFILLSWVSDIKVNISVLLDNRETSANVYKVGSSTRLDEYGESGWGSGSAGISCYCSFSGCDFLFSDASFFPNKFFSGCGSFLKVELSF